MQTAAIRYSPNKTIQRWLQSSPIGFIFYVSLTSFVAYCCMYGFRKPFTVAEFSNYRFMGISYKVCLVISQVLGYMLSKFYGIRFISTMKPERRAFYIIFVIGIAWLSLLMFAIIPAPYNIICLFINGLPLGLVWGLVFGFLEGRKTTELMGAVLSTSFIFASGLAKTVGKWLLLQININEWWMPFVAGAIFMIPLTISVWLLNQTPPPTKEDVAMRSIRKPMTIGERRGFIKKFGLSIAPVILGYAIFTIVRDFSEDFANELWTETGYQNNIGIFAKTSTIISLVVLSVIGSFFLIKNNFKAFKICHYIIMAGALLTTLSTICFNLHLITPFMWMLCATTGLYLGYLPFNCFYFERMLATYKVKGNIGFVMYIADAFGYLGTVLVLLIKEFIPIKYSWVHFFSFLFYSIGIMGIVLVAVSLIIHTKLFKSLNSNSFNPLFKKNN